MGMCERVQEGRQACAQALWSSLLKGNTKQRIYIRQNTAPWQHLMEETRHLLIKMLI